MTKLTAAQKTQFAQDERKFKSAVVRFACDTYVNALRLGVTGTEMDTLHDALDDVGNVGAETLRDMAWDVEACVKAKHTAALGF